MALADRMKHFGLSPTLKISGEAKAMRAEGIDVIDLSVGEPDFPTPRNVKDAAQRAIAENATKYTPNDGLPELKRAIIERIRLDSEVEYQPKNIIVSSGAKNCLFNLCLALLNKGDEVIIPAPYWVSYPPMVQIATGTPVIIPTEEENGFRLTVSQLRAALSDRTKAIIINNPCNPTGAAYTREELNPVAEVCSRKNITMIADEIYQKLVYDGFTFASVASLGELIREHAVIINGVSKAYSMTGWRIGYATGPQEIIAGMGKIQSHNTSCACSISQKASIEALSGPQAEVEKMAAEFQKRRDIMLERVQAIPGLSCTKPRGAFYLFPNVRYYLNSGSQETQIQDSSDMAYYLLKQAHVAVVPGEAFGMAGHIRLSYATSLERIEKAMDRIEKALTQLKPR